MTDSGPAPKISRSPPHRYRGASASSNEKDAARVFPGAEVGAIGRLVAVIESAAPLLPTDTLGALVVAIQEATLEVQGQALVSQRERAVIIETIHLTGTLTRGEDYGPALSRTRAALLDLRDIV